MLFFAMKSSKSHFFTAQFFVAFAFVAASTMIAAQARPVCNRNKITENETPEIGKDFMVFQNSTDLRNIVQQWCTSRESVENVYGPIGEWYFASTVTDMARLFAPYQCRGFNEAIGNWDVSQVTKMNAMFIFTTAFNQPLGNWKVGKVT